MVHTSPIRKDVQLSTISTRIILPWKFYGIGGLETLFSAILVYICSFVKELFAGRGQAPPLPYTVEHLGRVW